MKQCPVCRRTYTDEYQNFCLDDGVPLQSMSIHSTDPTMVQTSPNAPTVVQTVANDLIPGRTFSRDPTVVQTAGEVPARVTTPSPRRPIPLYVYMIIALLVVILGGGAVWWKYSMPRPGSESNIPAVKVGNELRDEFRRGRDKLDKTGVADFDRAEEKLELLRSIDGDNGRAWYYAGEIKRVKDTVHFDQTSCARSPMEPAFDPEPYEQDFYRYLELAARETAPDDTDMSDQICYTRPNGVCLQRTAWIEHLLAIDLYRAAMAAKSLPDRAAKLDRAAKHVQEALKYRQPEGGQGFGQCVDTLALEQLIKDASVGK